MSTRYVWSRYSVNTTQSLTTGSKAAAKGSTLQIARSTTDTQYFTLCSSLSYDADSGTFTAGGTYKIWAISDLDSMNYTYDSSGSVTDSWATDVVSATTYPYLILNSASSTDSSGTYAVTTESGSWNLYRLNYTRAFTWNDSAAIYYVTVAETYSQGSTSYGTVTNATAGTYGSSTSGTEVNGYWYVYQGSDSITPAALSCSASSPQAGQMVTLTVTAVANTYGGTISYTYEVSLDGGDTWETLSTTTGTELTYAVPEDAETVTFQVTAADATGFTDTEAVATATLTVITNTAPTAPGAPVVAEDPVMGGETVTVSWTAAEDAEDNLAGYCLERSYNGGSFTQIYQGTALTASDSITWGWATVQYRVRAYDSCSAYSDYAAGSSLTIVNNTAPEAPATLSIPASIYNGTAFKLSWTAASDTDGDLAGYTVQVSTDGGESWEDTGLSPGADDTSAYYTVTGASQIQLRILAYDSYGYTSDWTYSATRTVITNVAPDVTVSVDGTAYDSGADLGAYTDAETGPVLSISVTDTDGDACTLTLSLDGSAMLSDTLEDGSGAVTASFTAGGEQDWQTVTNSSHTVQVTVSDGTETVTWTGSFTKTVTTAIIQPAQVQTVDGTITGVVMAVSGSVPADASLTVTATADGENYEDISEAVTAGDVYNFTNTGSSFHYIVTVQRGETAGYVSNIKGVLIVEQG